MLTGFNAYSVCVCTSSAAPMSAGASSSLPPFAWVEAWPLARLVPPTPFASTSSFPRYTAIGNPSFLV